MQEKVTGTDTKSPGSEKFQQSMEAMKQVLTNEDLPNGGTPSEENNTVDKSLAENKDDSANTQEVAEENEANVWAKRYNNLQTYADKQGTLNEKIALKMLEKDPNAIHDIAELDEKLADKIVSKDLGQSNIKTYKELVEYLNNNNKSSTKEEETSSKSESELEKRLKLLEEETKQMQLKQAEAFFAEFKKVNPEFNGEVEATTWRLFKQNNMEFEQAFKYAKLEHGISTIEAKAKEEAYKSAAEKKLASSFGGGSGKSVGVNKPKIDSSAKNFLEGIGAKKTLGKYN